MLWDLIGIDFVPSYTNLFVHVLIHSEMHHNVEDDFCVECCPNKTLILMKTISVFTGIGEYYIRS